MRLRPLALLAAAALAGLAAPASAAAQEPAAKLDAFLQARLSRAPGEAVPILIAVRPPPAPQALRVPGPEEPLPRSERHVRTVTALRANAATAQAGVIDALRRAEAAGTAREVEPLWIANYVRAEVDPVFLTELEGRADVERVYLDRPLTLEPPGSAPAGAAAVLGGAASNALQAVRADQAWDLGFTGKGMLLANLDSGVQGDHPALAGKWRGLRAPVEQAWFDPFRNSTFPVDDDPPGIGANGHGTATMGLLVAGERTIGVAFEAEWIAANIFENNQSFASTILKGIQWATDPDGDPATLSDTPDVINASFGLTEIDSLGGFTDDGFCDDIFDAAIDAAQAAGPIVLFSAGNFISADPGDISPPGSSLNVLAVGAVDDEGRIAPFSGRGPSLCEGPDNTKPNLVAPGVDVLTLNRQGGEQRIDGTSFSAPIAGGIAALVRQKNPALTSAEVRDVLLATAADLGDPGPDNTFGRGLVDAAAAVGATDASGPLLRLTGFGHGAAVSESKPVPQGSPVSGFLLVPGENVLSVRLTNPTQAEAPAGPARLTSRSPLVEVLDGDADLPSVPPGGDVLAVFRVRLAPGAPAGADLGLTLALPPGAGPAAVPFTLVAGGAVEGQFATHDANDIRTTVTNFGAIGFWLGLPDPSGGNALLGEGFHFPADDEVNYLFHGSFLVGRSAAQVSDDIPYGNVSQSVNDFHTLPGAPFRVLQPGPVAAQEIVGAYDDSYNFEGELGVSVTQHSYAFSEDGRRDFVILTYDVANRTSEALGNLHFGLFADWDFLDDEGFPSETMDFVTESRLGLVQGLAGSPTLGITLLNSVGLGDLSYRVLELEEFSAADGFEISESDKFDFLSDGVVNEEVDVPQDLAHVLGFGPVTIAPGDSFQAAFAFVAAGDVSDLRAATARARSAYASEILGQEPPPGGIPSRLTLEPPFPNPLPPGEGDVTLRFGVPQGDLGPFEPRETSLRIVDVRGRIVRTLLDEPLVPGNYERAWDGLDEEGRRAPSGVYVVLVESGSDREIRKLVVVR